ncbi:MAG: trypsin-like peptidase domain-containing protein [Dehalococcoidia bacterium]
MAKLKLVIPVCLFLTLILILAPSAALSAEKEYPAGVTMAKEATVEVMAWVDGWISDGWDYFEAKGPVSLGSGFFANENGDVFTAAHCVNMSEDELTEAAIMYYIGGAWFEDGWYEKVDFGSFYSYYYSTVWWAYVQGELTISAEEVDYVYRYGEGEAHRVEDILFYEDPTTGTDIAILETGLSGTPYLGLQQAPPTEGSRAYVIGYAGIDLTLEFWQAMDAIMADPSQRPGTFSELMLQAADAMVEGISTEGPSIETGLLGSSTRFYEMDARRFHGTAWGGLSGGPVIDELGNCLGLLPWGQGDSRGYFIPAQHLNEASREAGIDTFPALAIGEVTVEPYFLGEGDSFQLSAEVTNLGFSQGDYTAALNLSDGTQASQPLSLAAGATETLVLSATKSAAGLSTGLLEIGRASAELTVNPIALSNLTIKPLEPAPDENIRVQVEAVNLSEETVTASLDLSVDGVVAVTQSLILEGGAGETVTFLVSRDAEATYELTVGNLSQPFTVKSALPLTLIGVGVAALLGLAGLIVGIIALVRLRG